MTHDRNALLVLIAMLMASNVFFAIQAFRYMRKFLRMESKNDELRKRLARQPSPILHLYDWRNYERNARKN